MSQCGSSEPQTTSRPTSAHIENSGFCQPMIVVSCVRREALDRRAFRLYCFPIVTIGGETWAQQLGKCKGSITRHAIVTSYVRACLGR